MEAKRAAIYARQSAPEDEGIARQVARCTSLIEERGWDVSRVYQRDNNVSASAPRNSKTDWGKMLQDIDSCLLDVVVAVNLDRLLRGIGDLHELVKRGVQVVTVEGDLDLASETGELHATVLAGVARFEVRRKASRAAAAAAVRRSAGHPPAGRTTFGYRWVPAHARSEAGTRYRIDPDEARVVRWMFAEALAGSPLGAICRELNNGTATDADGLPLGEATRTTRDGSPWRSPTVRRLLLSPFYAALLPESVPGSGVYRGELVDLDKCTPGAWEAIVSVDELRGTRRALLDPSRLQHDGTARRWLLSGLALCDRCGVPVRSARTRKGVHGYRCPRGHFMREGNLLDAYAEHVIVTRLSEPDAASLVRPLPGVDVAGLRAREAALSSELEEKFKLAGTGPTFTAERVMSMCAPLEAELDQVRAELTRATAVDVLGSVVGADDVRDAWGRLSLHKRRRVMSELLVVVIPPIGKGRRVLSLDDAARSLSIAWRKPGRANAALPSLSDGGALLTDLDYADVRSDLLPGLSDGMRTALAGLLR